MQKILLVEDDLDISHNICAYLSAVAPDLLVDHCADGICAYSRLATENEHALALVDIGLPGLDGLQLCRKLRQIGWKNPLIMLTAYDSTEDKIRGLEAGADDYISKPFSLAELHARIRAALRRGEQHGTQQTLRVADLSLNPETRQVFRAGQLLRLNSTTFRILLCLMRASPAVVSRESLANEAWPTGMPSADTIRSHIYMLRTAIDRPFDRPLLQTIPCIGWAIRDNES